MQSLNREIEVLDFGGRIGPAFSGTGPAVGFFADNVVGVQWVVLHYLALGVNGRFVSFGGPNRSPSGSCRTSAPVPRVPSPSGRGSIKSAPLSNRRGASA